MHDKDDTTFRGIVAGTLTPTWPYLFGDPDGWDYLSEAGQHVARRAATDLEGFFGKSWLPDAATVREGGARIPELVLSAPAYSQTGPLAGYAELVRWWVWLGVLTRVNPPGSRKLRSDARGDVKPERLAHTLTQARLAATAVHLGAIVELEPGDPRPGDVLVRTPDAELLVEVFAVMRDANFAQEAAATDRTFARLREFEFEFGIHFSGDPPTRPKALGAKWDAQMTQMAIHAATTGRPITIELPGGGALTASPGDAPIGTQLSGPPVGSDRGARLMAKLAKKAGRTKAGGPAWLWVEDRGLFHPFPPFEGLALPERVDALAALLRPLLVENPHLRGVAFSMLTRHWGPVPEPESCATAQGAGHRVSVSWDGQRETLIVYGGEAGPDHAVVDALCKQEPAAIDAALLQLGAAQCLDDLLSASAT